MKFLLTVRFKDGREVEVTAGSQAQLAWEQASPGRAVGQLLKQVMANEYRITDLYSLAHAAMEQQDLYSGSLKDFHKAAEVEMGHNSKGEESAEVDTTDEDPTQPGPSDEH
jgi:hypothetical protein